MFGHVLEFLRSESLPEGLSIPQERHLMREAQYFQVYIHVTSVAVYHGVVAKQLTSS